ncbi:MAG: Lpp/OprI family alanine-zipper lipoprotein [Steroidobacteraceae bacterium]
MQLHSRGKFGVVAPAAKTVAERTRSLRIFCVCGFPEATIQKGICMKSAIVLKVAAAAAVVVLAGCTDLKPMQAQVDDLKSQVGRLQSELASAKSAADSANSTAQSANQAASGAQSTANQALAAAQASQSCCDATNEKIDRMFRRSISK